jgi:acetaldehyde dehydrogenase (acetylating)
MGKQLVNFITCGCESSAPFVCNLSRVHHLFVIYKAGCEPTPYWWYACRGC